MNYWIFQSIPDRYDLRNENNLHKGMDGWWYATRYRNKMNPGDSVFFWMGGDTEVRGIYGFGTITSLPFQEGDVHKVKVHVTERLQNHFEADRLRHQSELQNLMILKIAIGSNFLLSKLEGEALMALIKRGN